MWGFFYLFQHSFPQQIFLLFIQRGVLALRGAWERNIPECVVCHGPSGVGVGKSFPPLVGPSAQYLSSQLRAWQLGTRKNDPSDLMGHIARSLTDSEIKAVSEYFANLTASGASR